MIVENDINVGERLSSHYFQALPVHYDELFVKI